MAKINKIDERGWYVCMDSGIHYLYTDGEVRHYASVKTRKGAVAFWHYKADAKKGNYILDSLGCFP